MRPVQDKTKANMMMILEILQKYRQLHIRGIRRIIKEQYNKDINPYTINRIVTEYLSDYIEIIDLKKTVGVRLKFCSLKPEYREMDRQKIVKNIVKKALDKHRIRLKIHTHFKE